jgi:hypothetical protein
VRGLLAMACSEDHQSLVIAADQEPGDGRDHDQAVSVINRESAKTTSRDACDGSGQLVVCTELHDRFMLGGAGPFMPS